MSVKYSNNPEIDPQQGGLDHLKLSHIAAIIIFGIFATTFAQPQVLGRLPITNLLKNELHVDRTAVASFFFLCGLAWYFKPFAGILTDAFPLFRTRRRHYLLISAVLACLSWLSLIWVPHQYTPLLITCIVINAFMVIASTVVGAILVETGQKSAATGRLTSVRILVQQIGSVLQGHFGGLLASSAFMIAAGVNAFFILSIFPIAFVWLRERPVATTNQEALSNAGVQLKKIFSSSTLWWAIAFLGLFYFAPGFSTPLLFKQQNEFGLSMQNIGDLQSVSGLAAVAAALLYAAVCRKWNLRTMILIGVLANAAGNFMYLTYSNNMRWDALIEAQNGVFFTICEIALLDLAARSTPKGCEGLGYSLMLSMRNFALFGADVLGSRLADQKVDFYKLVTFNSATTLLVLVLLPFLPKAVTMVRDSAGKFGKTSEAAA